MGKTTKAPMCDRCKQAEAIYAVQYIGEDKPSFYTLGWHTRGFRIVARVCQACADKIKEESCTKHS